MSSVLQALYLVISMGPVCNSKLRANFERCVWWRIWGSSPRNKIIQNKFLACLHHITSDYVQKQLLAIAQISQTEGAMKYKNRQGLVADDCRLHCNRKYVICRMNSILLHPSKFTAKHRPPRPTEAILTTGNAVPRHSKAESAIWMANRANWLMAAIASSWLTLQFLAICSLVNSVIMCILNAFIGHRGLFCPSPAMFTWRLPCLVQLTVSSQLTQQQVKLLKLGCGLLL